MDVTYRFLDPDDAELLPAAIRSAYGDSYDLDWVYDVEEVRRRLDDGRYTSMAAISAEGAMLCHGGMAKTNAADRVGHSGQAITPQGGSRPASLLGGQAPPCRLRDRT